MFDFYTWTTPNGRKISILLEELGVDYEVHPINIGEGEQKTPEFLKISSNNKIPVIVDRETGATVMESGAILIYLAEKHDRFSTNGSAQKIRSYGVVDVADGRTGTHARTSTSIPAFQSGQS